MVEDDKQRYLSTVGNCTAQAAGRHDLLSELEIQAEEIPGEQRNAETFLQGV